MRNQDKAAAIRSCSNTSITSELEASTSVVPKLLVLVPPAREPLVSDSLRGKDRRKAETQSRHECFATISSHHCSFGEPCLVLVISQLCFRDLKIPGNCSELNCSESVSTTPQYHLLAGSIISFSLFFPQTSLYSLHSFCSALFKLHF